jgi:hypothetical protein
MTQKIEIGDGLSIELVFDGNSKRVLGNFMGVVWTPPEGGRSWWAVNGDCGDGCTDRTALAEIREAWKS